MPSHRVRVLMLAAATIAGAMMSAAAQSTTTVEGTIANATPTSATIATKMGSTTVALTNQTRVIRRLPATLADVKVGSFLAITASKAADGTLTAVSVNILDAMPSARKGQWPMESGNVMTNMNVTSIVEGKSGRTLKLSYQDQSTSIVVPDGTPIRRIMPGNVGDLKTGAHVRVHGGADAYGVITASYVSIE
jgi:hypothetical protein